MKMITSKNSISDLLGSSFETAFNDSFFNSLICGHRSPLINIFEKENLVTVEMAIPGYKKSDLEISVENNVLIVKGKKNIENETSTRKFLKREFITQEFSKVFGIDSNITDESITSKLEDGILTIQVPRAKKAESKKTITIL